MITPGTLGLYLSFWTSQFLPDIRNMLSYYWKWNSLGMWSLNMECRCHQGRCQPHKIGLYHPWFTVYKLFGVYTTIVGGLYKDL